MVQLSGITNDDKPLMRQGALFSANLIDSHQF
jgi:hypothetical protein